MPVKRVKVTEANQQFSKLIREVEHDGATVCILRRERPVAILMPEGKNTRWHKARATEIARMRQLLDKGLRLGAEDFDRDTLHDRK